MRYLRRLFADLAHRLEDALQGAALRRRANVAALRDGAGMIEARRRADGVYEI